MRRVTGRARKTSIDVERVLRPTCVPDDIAREIVAFAAHRVRPIDAQIRIYVQVSNSLAGTRRLAIFVTPLQDVGPFGSVRTTRTQAAEFAVVVTVVTVRTKNLVAHLSPLTGSIELRHVGQQTGLRVSRGTRVRHGMA